MADADKEFVEQTVKAIVDHPEDVKTKRTVDEMGVLIELSVHPEDMGKIIGKEGRTAKAIRILLRVLGAKNNARVNLKIIEPEGGREGHEAKSEEKTSEKAEKPLDEGQATEVV
ncbi:MAG: KH domain-containing protein [Patescibacteria group bacterium]